MVGVYFSGSGNTKHCVEFFVNLLDESVKTFPIESEFSVSEIIKNDVIVFGYPIHYSNAPKYVRDFILSNKSIFTNKKIFIIATMGLFSGDGAGRGARLFEKCGAEILGGLHLKMPDSIGDVKALKKSPEENKRIIADADLKMMNTAAKIKNGEYPTDGLSKACRLAGLFGQRLWFYGKTLNYTDKLKIGDECVGCGKCERICPMNNIEVKNGKAAAFNKCTMCYKCVNNCPKKAITLIGKNVLVQYKFEDYISGVKD